MNLTMIYSALNDIAAPITQVFPATEGIEGGIVIDDTWLIQVSKNSEEPILLDLIDTNGMIHECGSFNSINNLLKFMMEN